MSSADTASCSSSKSKVLVPINTFWLETLFWSFKDDDTLTTRDFFRSKYFQIPTLEDVFFFRVGKVPPTTFAVQLHRVLVDPEKRPDAGYFLEAFFTLIGSRIPPQSQIMDSDSDSVSVSYAIEILNKPQNDANSWTVKCVIKLHEISCRQNESQSEQQSLLHAVVSRLGEKKAEEMQLNLHRKSLADVFSGRQKKDFAVKKCILLERTFNFASEKARRWSNEKEIDSQSPWYLYLGYILKGKFESISKIKSAELYIVGHHYGLEYLQAECTDFMLRNLDVEFVIDILLVSDMVNDFELLDKALDIFLTHRHQIMATDRWQHFKHRNWQVAHSIIDASIRKATLLGAAH